MSGVSYFIGIDPGVSGGIAIIDHLGIVQLLYKMPDTIPDLLAILAPFDQVKYQVANPLDPGKTARAVLERVNAGVFAHGPAARKMGVVSAFTFGRGVGRLETALAACRVPYDEVSPLTWQTALGCKSGGDKSVTKRRAQQLFPTVAKMTHYVADALLMAEFCRRFHGRIGAQTSAVPGVVQGASGLSQATLLARSKEVPSAGESVAGEAEGARPEAPHASGRRTRKAVATDTP